MTYNELYKFIIKPLPDHRQWLQDKATAESKESAPPLPQPGDGEAVAAGSGGGGGGNSEKKSDVSAAAPATATDADIGRTPLEYIRERFIEALNECGDNTANNYKAIDDISEQGIDLHARVFGSGYVELHAAAAHRKNCIVFVTILQRMLLAE